MMSCCVYPDVLRNFLKSASFGKLCCFCWLKDLVTSALVTLMPIESAWPSIHLNEISSCTTCWRSELYCCTHWALSWASVTFGWPLAGFGVALRLAAMHLTYPSCGSG